MSKNVRMCTATSVDISFFASMNENLITNIKGNTYKFKSNFEIKYEQEYEYQYENEVQGESE